MLSPRHCLPFLQPGRLVSLQCPSSDEDLAPIFFEDRLTWGLVINFERVKSVSEGENFQWFLVIYILCIKILVCLL